MKKNLKKQKGAPITVLYGADMQDPKETGTAKQGPQRLVAKPRQTKQTIRIPPERKGIASWP
jgi:hypothetical protein